MAGSVSDAEMLDYDFFSDDKDGDGIRNHTVKVVVTRKEHECLFRPEWRHAIPVGTRARRDQAIVDGEWKTFYSCDGCHLRERVECLT